METEEEQILDMPDSSGKKPNYNVLGYIGLGVTAVGLVEQWLHFPYYMITVVIGFLLMALRYTLIFSSEKRQTYEWFYFLGKGTLVLCLPFIFFYGSKASLLFIVPAALFLCGTFTAPSK